MKQKKIHIDEENTQIIWGLIAMVSIGFATYILINAFMAGSWKIAGYTQLASIVLFTIGFYGIIRISSPLFHFILYEDHGQLIIEIWKEGEEPVDIKTVALNDIQELRIAPHSPRAPNEALFDFSSSYYLLYRKNEEHDFHRLIDLEDESFTLKVEDIGKIIGFLKQYQATISIPEEHSLFIAPS